jgi:hypothetical protein
MKKGLFVLFAVSVVAVFAVAFQDSVVQAISFVPLPAPKVAAIAQTFVGEISDGQCAANGSHDAVMKKASVNSPVNCVRGCAKKHGLVLIDASSKAVYKLDNPAKALPFAAQKATVTGTLDKATNTIHVTSVAAAK